MYPIDIQNIAFSFDYSTLILSELTLRLKHGGFTGILGPNGSGKTTLVGLISRWHKPSTGQILLQGQAINTIPHKELARQLAVVEQESQWGTDITVRELVALGRLPHQSLLSDESDEDLLAISSALVKTGMSGMENRRLSTLSGGEKQRTRIAVALAQQTEILILDEPTTHLDIRHQMELLNLLKELSREGLTVIAVLHDLNLAALYCDSLVLLKSGKVFVAGTVESALTATNIEAVYGSRAVVFPHPVYKLPQVALLKQFD